MSRSKLADFEILTRLGSGSFGTVYKVRRIVDESLYVIKNVRIVELTFKEQSEAINEVQILAQLKSPYVVRYYDSFIEKDCLHIVMEYCNRGDLQALIKKAKEKNVTCLKEDVIWNIALQVILGLHYLHKKHILHRDLKSANVFLMKDPNYPNYLVKIGDLGVAKQMDTSTALANTIVGTPYYLSPELCADMPYRDKSDCWAFGVLLYQCCTLQHPFEARNQCALIMKIIEAQVHPPSSSNISAELTNLIMWVLQKDPNLRPTMRDVLNEEFVRGKLTSHNFDLPNDLEECKPTTSLNSKTPPAPSVSVLDTESTMLKEKMISFHRTVNASDNAATPPPPAAASGASGGMAHQNSKSRLLGADGTTGSGSGNANGVPSGLTRHIRVGSMRSNTMSSTTGSEKSSGVAGNRVRPGAKKTVSVKALTMHQVKPPLSQTGSSSSGVAGSSPGGVMTPGGGTPRKVSTPRVDTSTLLNNANNNNNVNGNDDVKSVHERVDTSSQEKMAPQSASQAHISFNVAEGKVAGSSANLLGAQSRRSSKSTKDIIIDIPESVVSEYKAEAKGTFVKKLSRPTPGSSRHGSYKDIPEDEVVTAHLSNSKNNNINNNNNNNNNRRPSNSGLDPNFSPPSEQPSVNYDSDAFEEYVDSSEVSPSMAVTKNRLREEAKRMIGDVEDEVDVLKTPFITMGPLKSFRTAPVEEKTFHIPITPSHAQDIDSMFRQTDDTALSGLMFRESQDLNIAEWSPVWTQNRGLINPSANAPLSGRKGADAARNIPDSIDIGIASTLSKDDLDTEDVELYAFQNGNFGSSDDEEDEVEGKHDDDDEDDDDDDDNEEHDDDDNMDSVESNEEDEVDEQTAHELEQAAEAQLRSLGDLIHDSKTRSIAKFGADLFAKIYDLCAKHMGVQVDEKNVTQAQREMNMGSKASSFMRELEKYVSESGKGIELAREAVVGIKVLLALESKYEDVLISHNLNPASHK